MRQFEPIAIVGQGCVLPGCRTPQELWAAVKSGRSLLSHLPANGWRIDANEYLSSAAGKHATTPVRSDIGGFVQTAAADLALDGLRITRGELEALDPVVQWSVHAAVAALADAKISSAAIEPARGGVILGNLSYPTRSLSQLYESLVLGETAIGSPASATNRFMSGLPALLTAQALGFTGPSFCLDAACASGLYAIKLACDKLQRGECDLMVAGGVNASDPLFIFSGFATLNALSQTGRSRPFHREADGLVPSEGAACVILKRLVDAERAGDRILGVIRGIGLSNDGRSGGFLSPSWRGQERAIRAAFAVAGGLTPAEVSLIECHATGTAAGDGVEVRGLETVYGQRGDLHLTALKANLGHSITTSAVAGVLKTLAALEHGLVPPTPNAFPLLPALDACGYRVHDRAIDWAVKATPLAAVSAFGMGGNNAHLLLQRWEKTIPRVAVTRPTPRPIAIVALGIRTERCADTGAFVSALLQGSAAPGVPATDMTAAFEAKSLVSPPRDLKRALGQQLLLLETALATITSEVRLDVDSTGVFVGMQTDPAIARHTLRIRLETLVRSLGHAPSEEWLAAAHRLVEAPLEAADVVGTMPNIPANRLHHQFDLRGAGFTVSAEENSGIAALTIALDALQSGEISSAIVGAVDLSRELCHEHALRATLPASIASADAAVVLVLKPLDAAQEAGEPILATIETTAGGESDGEVPVTARIVGHAHAAAGLLEVAAAVLGAHYGAQLDSTALRLVPKFGAGRRATQEIVLAPAQAKAIATTVKVRATDLGRVPLPGRPRVHGFAGENISDLRRRLADGQLGGDGPCRLAFVAGHATEAREHIRNALAWLQAAEERRGRAPVGVHFQAAPIPGDLAFVFTGAAAGYPGMGRELFVGMPRLLDGLAPLLTRAEEFGGWAFEPGSPRHRDPFMQLAGCSFISQVHARLTREVLGLEPKAVLGLSSGETNSMYALGIWSEPERLFDEIRASELYTRHLGGEFASVRAHWGEAAGFKVEWENWMVRAPVDEVRVALEGETRAYLTIVNTAQDSVVGGDRAACARVLARLSKRAVVAPLGHDLAVHCAAVGPFESVWRRLHTRAVKPVDGLRVYSNFLGGVYTPTETTVADVLTGQAVETIDFRKVVELAYRDGARIFVEHGPRNHLTSALSAILGARPHLAVALDVSGRSSLVQATDAVAALWAASVNVRLDEFAAAQAPVARDGARLQFQLRKPTIVLPLWREATTPEVTAIEAVSRVLPRPPELLPVSATVNLVADLADVAEEPSTAEGRIIAAIFRAHRDYVDRQSAGWNAYLSQQQQLQELALTIALGRTGGAESLSAPPLTPSAPPPSSPAPAPSPKDIWDVAPLRTPQGPRFDRAQLEILASGKISSVLGPQFAGQDDYAIQVRMPEPPLLLCDRVLGIEGEPGSMGQGIIWTETDVREDSWYLHCGRMPGGVFIEAGQADLLLISWLGVDALNRGERAYRLLGCELMFHEALPKVGDTLRYQIHVDRHANQGSVRLFFFHYDCWIGEDVRISVRNGQAGFFSKEELAHSGGVLWSADDAPYLEPGLVELPEHATSKRAFSAADVAAFARGELESCFGANFDWSWIHSRTPSIPTGRNNLIGEIATLDPRGGPAGRGYLKAVRRLAPDDWFFDGHFKNDPCMPGTLMAEGCLQAMTFYLVALGFSRDRDGWRTEPVPETKYSFVCRGQATPSSRELVYELFIDEIGFVGDQPTLFAHVLCTVDGLKAFKCERLGLRLVKDFPLSSLPRSAWERPERLPVAQMDGLTLDYKSLVACALGHPVDAFGPTFQTFAKVLRAPRLPNPPFLFCTHVARAERTPQLRESKAWVDMLYDIEDGAWYFTENSHPVMALTAVMEIALQACGWLSSYVLEPEFATWEPLFRNLDGVGTYYREINPGDGVVQTRVHLTSRVVLGEQIIVRFHVLCTLRGERVFECKTTFGSFSPKALADTKGMIPAPAELTAVKQPGNCAIDLAESRERYRREKFFDLPGPRLLRLDRITGIWPKGGAFGLGYIRGEKDVRKSDWVFQKHFYQDPVQPGSIGVESVMVAVRVFMLETETIPAGCRPEFETLLLGHEFDWTYRGQVLPHQKMVTVDFDVKVRTTDADGVTITGDGRLWVDGKKIYSMSRLGTRLRFVPMDTRTASTAPTVSASVAPGQELLPRLAGSRATLDLAALRGRFVARFGASAPVLRDLFLGLVQQFVGSVRSEDPEAYGALSAQPVLYLANHQVGVESILFVALIDALNAVPCRAIAKREHADSWIGRILALLRAQSGNDAMVLFDRNDPAALLKLLTGMTVNGRLTHSLMAHVHGTRSLVAGEPVTQVSAALLDLALRCELPIVPVRFAFGLPREPLTERLEFPFGAGAQHYVLGEVIQPAVLRAMNLRDRKASVIDALNCMSPILAEETAAPEDHSFTARVAALQSQLQLSTTSATLIAALENVHGREAATDDFLHTLHQPGGAAGSAEFARLCEAFSIPARNRAAAQD